MNRAPVACVVCESRPASRSTWRAGPSTCANRARRIRGTRAETESCRELTLHVLVVARSLWLGLARVHRRSTVRAVRLRVRDMAVCKGRRPTGDRRRRSEARCRAGGGCAARRGNRSIDCGVQIRAVTARSRVHEGLRRDRRPQRLHQQERGRCDQHQHERVVGRQERCDESRRRAPACEWPRSSAKL